MRFLFIRFIFKDGSAKCTGRNKSLGRNDKSTYVEREPIESLCYSAIMRQGALIRIKAPRQMGKTYLMMKVLSYAREQSFHIVVVSFRLADADIFSTLDKFLQWLCAIISDQLNLAEDISPHWKAVFGSNYNCTHYLGKIVLAQLPSPVVIAFDDVDVLFHQPNIVADFLGLLRAWCERSKHSNPPTDMWHKLRLIVLHSTEVYISLNQHQSPFNVGLSIELPEFTPEQIISLARQYGVAWSIEDANQLSALVGGKPDLVSLTLEWIADQGGNLETILREVNTPANLYHEHLRQQFRLIQEYPELVPLLAQVMSQAEPVKLAAIQAFQLESLGLVQLEGQSVRPSCKLYEQYFGSLLESP
ncbi:MAG: serine/threonine protein kinase [Phormidesmis sp. RL_2_1]|nr:serine/threonine protein kinase [Phormidesmis sp. RL_2_1]